MRHFTLNTKAALMTCAGILMMGLPMQASDQDSKIEAAAKSSHNFKSYLKDDNIKVESKEGVVTLTGTVSRDYHKFLPRKTDQSAARITMKVKTALAFHKQVSAVGTDVNTGKGVVTLTGMADSDARKQLTGEYAKDVEGVTEVRNKLVVSKPAHPPKATIGEKVDDASITAQIKTTLLFRKSTHALATKVHTKNGMVTLHGEARNAAERDLVGKIADDIHGVTMVHNKMTVKKP